MFHEGRNWYEGNPSEPREQWGGLNEYEYKSLQLMADFRDWTRDEFQSNPDAPCKTYEDVQALYDRYTHREQHDHAA